MAWSSNPSGTLRLLLSQDILTTPTPLPGMFLRDPALTYDAGGPVGATGSNGPRAVGAAGPVVLALRAHPDVILTESYRNLQQSYRT